jgi:ATP-binding cassette, subfamily B (MDR/TAP), member 1
VLHNVSLFFPAGETTFIVGNSGSGKSTVGNLVMKYYKPLAGDILVDGNSIQNLDNDWLRHNITLVQQDSVLFNETILQNILFGNRDNSDIEDVQKACKTAYLSDTIQEMANGLDTVAGLGGRLLSGGQRQRVAIARARLRDAPILIMDESTSALDYTSRQQVMEAIRQWRKGKTTIIITHDMSQILEDDYVYVLDHTQVVQEGYRKKLDCESPGTFASILCSDKSLEDNQQIKTPEVTSIVEPLEEDFSNRWDYISKVFSKSGTPPSTAISGFQNHNRLSFGFRVPQANALKSDLICSSHIISSSPHISVTLRASPRVPSPTLINKDAGGTPRAPISNFTNNKHESPAPRLRSLPTNASTTSSRSSLIPPQPPGEVVREKIPGHKPEEVNEAAPVPLTRIFSTIWPILSGKDRIIFVAGFFASFVVAVGTPAFAYVFARLLSVFYLPRADRADQALKFALSLLGIAIVDGLASFCAHYMLEYSAQSWITRCVSKH